MNKWHNIYEKVEVAAGSVFFIQLFAMIFNKTNNFAFSGVAASGILCSGLAGSNVADLALDTWIKKSRHADFAEQRPVLAPRVLGFQIGMFVAIYSIFDGHFAQPVNKAPSLQRRQASVMRQLNISTAGYPHPQSQSSDAARHPEYHL